MKKNEIIIYESDDHSTALEVRIEDETVWLTQYPEILVKEFTKSHDRFLIIDSKIVYHIGASLKDLSTVTHYPIPVFWLSKKDQPGQGALSRSKRTKDVQ